MVNVEISDVMPNWSWDFSLKFRSMGLSHNDIKGDCLICWMRATTISRDQYPIFHNN